MLPPVTIRPAETPAEFLACQQAQKRAWGITDDSYLVPLATMVGVQHHGGLVLGAFAPDGSVAGLSFAFLGRIHGRLCLYSQLTGVVPEYQGQGLGQQIKDYQRTWARGEGLESIAWSFDPLQAGNARFNLRHLRATATKFIEDMYGPRTDAVNAAAPTDRLIAEWPVTPAPAATRPTLEPADLADLPSLIRTRAGVDGSDAWPEIAAPATDLGPTVLLPIPDAVGSLRTTDPTRASAWTEAIRQAFPAAFAAGYVADDFVRDPATGQGAYVLRR